MKPLFLTSYTAVNALGHGRAAMLSALRGHRSGLRPCDFEDADLTTWIGRVEGLEQQELPGELAAFDCRNNRLAFAGLAADGFDEAVAAARLKYGAGRIGVFVATSTAGVHQTELAYRRRDDEGRLPADFDYHHTHSLFSLADFVRRRLVLEGPALVISTACSSSAKAFVSAYRHIQAGLCDAAVVGGVDSLCLSTLYGFNSLELVSASPCRPWDVSRDGINIGEGAGFALLEPSPQGQGGIALLGYGESSDAYHMSSPHPEGAGAALAMRRALTSAGLQPSQVDYINLHGTATPSNDAAEDRAIAEVFGADTPCSSTKGWTGHTLGAAGITEAVFACLSVEHGFMPKSLNTVQPDPALSARILMEDQEQAVATVLSNSLGFGGTNCSLILGRTG